MSIIILHPAVAADHEAAQALADHIGLELRPRGAQLHLCPPATPARIPQRIPAASWQRLPRHLWPTGGDAA